MDYWRKGDGYMADSRYKNNNAGDIVNGPDGAVRKQKVAVALQYNKR